MTVGRLLTALIVAPILFLSNCLSASAIMADDIPHKGLPGGYAPAKIIQDVASAANFAVHEQAKREVAPLKLANISKAEKQIVAGMKLSFHPYGAAARIVATSKSCRVSEPKFSLFANILGVALNPQYHWAM